MFTPPQEPNMTSVISKQVNRRQFMGAGVAAAGAIGLPAWAQDAKYPSKPITLIVPFPPEAR